jgi:hypothetical protein
MKRYINIALSIIAGISLTSCLDDLVGSETNLAPEGYMTIGFAVKVPDMNTVQTKAVDPDGGGVQQMTVFCFDENDLFITTVTADIHANASDVSLSGTLEVTIPDHTVTMQLVGNQNLTYFREDNYRGMSEVEVMSSLEASAGRMIYWSRKTVDELKAHNSTSNPVLLLRNQAKISLSVEGSVGFEQKGWVVVNSNAFGTVAPYCAEHGFEAPHYIDRPFVTLPENTTKLGDYLDVRTNAEEYIFETENTVDSPIDFIVKGSQSGGEDLYYRISIIDQNGEYIPILRNHHYAVNINGPLYYGQSTFAEALEAPATNNVWVSVSDEITSLTDGVTTLSVDKTSVVIGEDEFKNPNEYYLYYTLVGASGAAEVSWTEGNNVAMTAFTHTYDSATGRGTICVELNAMGDLQKREGTLLVKSGRLSRKIKVITVKEQKFEPAWITTNVYGKESGENVTMMFTIPEICPAELFPMDVLISVNDMDIRNASGMVLPIIGKDDSRYGEDNGIGYKYVLTVTEPGVQRVYLKTILDHTEESEKTVVLTLEAPHFVSLSKTATFQDAIEARILIHNLKSYVAKTPADEYIYYYLVPQKINAPVEFQTHLGEVVASAAEADVTLTNPNGVATHFRYISPNLDFSTTDGNGYNVDEFLLYSQNLEHNHDHTGTFYFDFYKNLDPANWSASGGRVLGFFRNENATPGGGATYHLKTTKPKSDEVVRIASNPFGFPSVTVGDAGELAVMNYIAPDGTCTGTGKYKSCVFELATHHPFHFAAALDIQGAKTGTNVQGENEEVVDLVEMSYAPGQSVNLEFDVTSFTSKDGTESVDPFGTAFDIEITAPMLELDTTSPLYDAGKISNPSEGRFIYHVAADRDAERKGSLEANKDDMTTASQVGERKCIPFKKKGIVSAGDIVISSDESKVVFYQKTFKIQNNSIVGKLAYRSTSGVVEVPAGSFVPFEMLPTYNRIGTVTISATGQFELRLRSEYKYDWATDDVKFQFTDENGVIYEKTYDSLSALNASLNGQIILEPVM